MTTDFQPDEGTGVPVVRDGAKVVVGGMITGRSIKYTKQNQTMAYLTLEDLYGTVEVVVFPRSYEKDRNLIVEDEKVFISGRVSAEDEKASKLICESIQSFRDIPRQVWIQFPDMETYREKEQQMYAVLRESDGKDRVTVYIRSMRAVKKLSENWAVSADQDLIEALSEKFGVENIKIV